MPSWTGKEVYRYWSILSYIFYCLIYFVIIVNMPFLFPFLHYTIFVVYKELSCNSWIRSPWLWGDSVHGTHSGMRLLVVFHSCIFVNFNISANLHHTACWDSHPPNETSFLEHQNMVFGLFLANILLFSPCFFSHNTLAFILFVSWNSLFLCILFVCMFLLCKKFYTTVFSVEKRPLEDSALWSTNEKSFEMWICHLVYSLIPYSEDVILR